MLLETIESPADLRWLDRDQLELLAAEIREFIVQAVSATGGHLGSNLGAVELTLAVHRAFNSPRDIVLWDTGHQAYAHKIVTGRQAAFATLRQSGGLSGYPSRAESVHDWVENSHASTILSYAHGLTAAIERSSAPDRRAVAVLGDGSLTGGMAYEGLNNLGHSGSRVVVVLNDNGRSYAPTVSHLSQSLTRLRSHPGLHSIRSRVEEALRGLPAVGPLAYASLQGMYAAVREVVEPRAFFESLGVRYLGPIDGHDVLGVEETLRHAAEFEGPTVVHVVTQKGRGYGPAECDDEKCLHDAPVFDPAIGPTESARAPKGYTQAFNEAMVEIGEQFPQVVAITAAMPGPTGLLPFRARWPGRFFDVGIAEAHAVTAAAGMAMGGLRPVVAVYATFFSRAFDQANLDVGLHGLPVTFALDRAGITGDDGPSHHGVLDLALCLRIAGMTIFAPSSTAEIGVMLRSALELDGPAAIRYPKGAAREVPHDQVGSGLRARRLIEGDGVVCLLAVGKMVEAAEYAVTLLAVDGLQPTLWDVRLVRPLDPAMIADAARNQVVVTIEDGVREGGAGSFMAQAIADMALAAAHRAPPVLVLGTPTAYIPQGKPAAIHASMGLDGPGIASAALNALARADAANWGTNPPPRPSEAVAAVRCAPAAMAYPESAGGVDKVLLAAPRSFCAGVEMAIKALAWLVELCPPPVYCYHEIVHNRTVVERFEAAGVVFVQSLDEVPEGATLMLSAHGAAPNVVRDALAKGGVMVDSVCPLVTKVHHEVKVRATKGYAVVYAGHAGHDEAVATMAVAPSQVHLVETEDDVAALDDFDSPVAVLAQTTLSTDDWQGVLDATRARYAEVWTPDRSDLCFATTNRQAALRQIVERATTVVVIGSPNSSNANALEAVARRSGTEVVRIDRADDLPSGISGVVGVTAAASTPEEVVQAVIARLNPAEGVEAVITVAEDEYFPPPPALRAMMRAKGLEHLLEGDRETSASIVLEALPAAASSEEAS